MRTPPHPVLIALALLAFGSACGDEAQHAAPPPADAGIGKVEDVIQRKLGELRQLEGREGILAEKSRYSIFDEELIIRDFFQDREGGFFVDVGCAWPIMANNTFYLEKHLGWRGIGIDALDDYAAEWAKSRPNSRFFSYLVTDRSGDQQTFFKSPSIGLSSADREMAAGEVFGANLEPVSVEIETITLDDLLDREGVTRIDLLAMDIEGHEPQALAGFDIDRFQPALVVVEKPVEQAAGDRRALYRYFEKHGYELIEKYLRFDSVNRYFKRKGS